RPAAGPAGAAAALTRRRLRPGGVPRPEGARVHRLTADARHAGRRLDDVAREWLAGILGAPPTRAAVRRLAMAGGPPRSRRGPRAPAFAVPLGAILAMDVRPALVRREPGPRVLEPGRVIHEDAALIAVDKPAGLPTVATADPGRAHLAGLVQRYLESRGGR